MQIDKFWPAGFFFKKMVTQPQCNQLSLAQTNAAIKKQRVVSVLGLSPLGQAAARAKWLDLPSTKILEG